MTDVPSDEDAAQRKALEQAIEELGRLKQTLQRAGRGEAPASEVQRAVNAYVHDHRDALTKAAAAVGEQVRAQLLAELYRWRAQLAQQRAGGASRTATPDGDEE